jgi:outer membrane protein assembly factor BamB
MAKPAAVFSKNVRRRGFEQKSLVQVEVTATAWNTRRYYRTDQEQPSVLDIRMSGADIVDRATSALQRIYQSRVINQRTSTMSKVIFTILSVLLLVGLSHADPANSWPSWRGADSSGAATSGKYAAKFSADEGLAWKLELPDKGCSTPIVWGDKIIVTTPDQGKDTVLCLDWKGKTQWSTSLGAETRGKHVRGSGSNPSPVTDGERLYVHFKSGRIAALDMAGKVLWQDNVIKRYGDMKLYWDHGTSPVLTSKYVVQAVMNQRSSYLVAFDKLTGEVAWHVDRHYNLRNEGDESYASPIPLTLNGKEIVLVWGGEHLDAHDAKDGAKLFSCGGFNYLNKRNWPHVSTPVIVGDVAIVPFGRQKKETLTGVKLGGSGDITESNVLWKRKDRGAFVTTPVAYKGKVYSVSGVQSRQAGMVTCLDPATGTTHWEGKLQEDRVEFFSSPVIADDKLYHARIDGKVFVAQVEPEFKVLSVNDMGEPIVAAPVPVGNHILIRGFDTLFCVAPPK